MILSKICGNTSVEDCRLALSLGADFVGVVVEVERSPRSVSLEKAAGIFSAFPGRAVLLSFQAGLDWHAEAVRRLNPAAIQMTGEEGPDAVEEVRRMGSCPVWKSIHLPARGDNPPDPQVLVDRIELYKTAGSDLIVLDTSNRKAGLFGGTGLPSDWDLACRVVRSSPLPVFLAGGIGPDNVVEAVRKVNPHGVDLASGVESEKGKKSPEKLARFFENLKSVQTHPTDSFKDFSG